MAQAGTTVGPEDSTEAVVGQQSTETEPNRFERSRASSIVCTGSYSVGVIARIWPGKGQHALLQGSW